MTRLRQRGAALIGACAMALAGGIAPAQAALPTSERAGACLDPTNLGSAARTGDGARAKDPHDVSVKEQRAIEASTTRILANRGVTQAEARAAAAATTIPVYVHVMRDSEGNGNVNNQQIARQIAVLNKTFAGQEAAGVASNTGFSFTLAGVDRFNNSQWHADRYSRQYRSQTREGGANALNIWLVDFKYLGIATFPWDYAGHPTIDGIRVHYASSPGGSAANYNLGETATHEAGHWLGLYHTFQGGCTKTNDTVSDTPAQSSPTGGCPRGRNSCSLPGRDPIHNYMDYSYDRCYNQFTSGQTSRIASMWTAYRSWVS